MLRVLIDGSPANGQFLLLGGVSPAMLRQVGESLLRRFEVIEVGGFHIGEVGNKDEARLWLWLLKNGQRVGVEFKRADAPGITASMKIAMQDLQLDSLYVVYPGTRRYALADRIEAVPLSALL